MTVSDDRRLSDAVADGARFVSVYDRLAGKGGPALAGADDRTHRQHNPAAATTAACSDADSDSPPPEAAESALPKASWKPLPPSVPKGRRVGTSPTTGSAATTAACSDANSDSPSPGAAESALPKASWKPLPPSVPKRRRVGTSPTTGSAAPPRHPRHGPTEATRSASGPTEHPDVEARPFWRRQPSLVPVACLRPKPPAVSHVDPSPSQKALQKAFIKWWTKARQSSGAQQQGCFIPSHAPPPGQQRNQDEASPTPSTPAEPSKDDQLVQGSLAQLGFAAAVIMGVRGGLNDVLSGWNEAVKVIFMLSLIVGAGTLGAGLMATSVMSTGYTRAVLSTSARFCTCLALFMLIVDLSLHMGSHGYIARIILGSVAVLFAVSVWVLGDPAAYGVYMKVQNGTKHLCGRLKRSCERGPILPT